MLDGLAIKRVLLWHNCEKRIPTARTRSAATLEAVILENVLPGTLMHTDKWASNWNLEQLGFTGV